MSKTKIFTVTQTVTIRIKPKTKAEIKNYCNGDHALAVAGQIYIPTISFYKKMKKDKFKDIPLSKIGVIINYRNTEITEDED